jgi:hypothetical protein
MSDLTIRPATVTKSQMVQSILANLKTQPPTNLADARGRLHDLLFTLRGSIDEQWASTDDKQAVLADISVRTEAVDVVKAAVVELEKAEAAATAALERTWNKLHSARTEQRVWRKLMPAT